MKILGVTLLTLSLGFTASASAAGMVTSVSNEALTIEGLGRGTSVAVAGVARQSVYYMSRVVQSREVLSDDDGDGTIRYAPPGGIAFRSIWIVVALSSGHAQVVTPDGFVPVQMVQRGAGRGKAVAAVAGTLDVGRNAVTMLIVRPGVGAWTLSAQDGSPNDRDGRVNGRLRIDLSKIDGLGANASSPPHVLQKGDVVALLDAENMEYSLTVTGEGAK